MKSKFKKSNIKFQTLKFGGGGGSKRPAPPLDPPFVINTSFRPAFELFCHFYMLNVRFKVFLIQEYRIPAILKKWRPFPDLRLRTCFFDKIVLKDVSYQISCLHHKLKDCLRQSAQLIGKDKNRIDILILYIFQND